MANPKQHGDFGEKIGGARKDLWQQRGLVSGDLQDMNSREVDKYLKKDNVWKKPDYDALIAGGIPFDVVYYRKQVRDSISAAPVYYRADDTPENRLSRQKEYIDTIREVQAVMENVKTQADAMNAYDTFFLGHGYAEQRSGSIAGPAYTITEKGNANPVITNKLSSAMYIGSDVRFQRHVSHPAKMAQFDIPKDQRVPKGYGIHFNDGKGTFSAGADWLPGTYYVTTGRRILKTNFENRSDALTWLREHIKGQIPTGKQKFIPPQLQAVKRDGPDYRRGRHIEGQDYLDAFAFRGGEFGNWLSQNDRQVSLDMGFDALKDLAFALNISDQDISYGGRLSIAFGARGSGNAVAHYEPLRQVINLTKMRGAGSLAHEWWHGLDDFLGQKYGAGGLLSENPHKHPLFKKLIDTMKRKPATPQQRQEMIRQNEARQLQIAESLLDQYVFPYIKKSGSEQVMADYEAAKNAYLQGDEGSVEQLSALKKSVFGRVIPKEEKQYLMTQALFIRSQKEKQPEPSSYTVPTDYYKNSKEMGTIHHRDGGYWDSNTEMTARAFATYVMDKLPTRSDYLVGHAECAIGLKPAITGENEVIRAYPQGEERRAINAVFDEIVAELKKEQIFTQDNRENVFLLPAAGPVKPAHQMDATNQAEWKETACAQISLSDVLTASSLKSQMQQAQKKSSPHSSHKHEGLAR